MPQNNATSTIISRSILINNGSNVQLFIEALDGANKTCNVTDSYIVIPHEGDLKLIIKNIISLTI